MIVDIDGERFHLATLHTDAKAAKMQLQQLVTRGDAGWYPLVGGGAVLVNWRAVKTVSIVECPNPVEITRLGSQKAEYICGCLPEQGGPHDLT